MRLQRGKGGCDGNKITHKVTSDHLIGARGQEIA